MLTPPFGPQRCDIVLCGHGVRRARDAQRAPPDVVLRPRCGPLRPQPAGLLLAEQGHL